MNYLPIALFWTLSASLSAFVNGNPAQPSLFLTGVVPLKNDSLSLRAGYVDDYVYSQHLQGEFDVPNALEKPPVTKLSTEAAILTMNIQKRYDLYGIIGSSKLQMDEEVFARRQFAWSIGLKGVIFEHEAFRIGFDFKYFQTNQKPLYLVSSGLPLNVLSDLWLHYREYQGSFGFAYKSELICPYVLGTYLSTKVEPNQHIFLVNVPGYEEPMDPSMRTFVGATNWGMAVGATLIMSDRGTLNVESRFFNQNGIDAALELRF